jgi:hypothetical protein
MITRAKQRSPYTREEQFTKRVAWVLKQKPRKCRDCQARATRLAVTCEMRDRDLQIWIPFQDEKAAQRAVNAILDYVGDDWNRWNLCTVACDACRAKRERRFQPTPIDDLKAKFVRANV